MSYSRWSNSIWYTYWDSSSGKTKDEQVFRVEDFINPKFFTFKELNANIDKCLKEVINGDKELKGYMKEFIADVKEEFKDKSIK